MHGVEAHAEGAEPHVVGHGAHTPRLEVHGGGRGEGLGEGGGVRHHAAQSWWSASSLQHKHLVHLYSHGNLQLLYNVKAYHNNNFKNLKINLKNFIKIYLSIIQ